VTDEERIAEGIKALLIGEKDVGFLHTVREVTVVKVWDITFGTTESRPTYYDD
jgi:hypothetical protein